VAIDIEVRRTNQLRNRHGRNGRQVAVDDVAGRTVGIIFTIETLSALRMTLPTMAASAIKRAHNDPTLRITYPPTDFQIELSPGNVRILTIGTPDGFTASFGLTEEFSQELGEAHLKGIGQRAKTH
jgi:hypothetical protein